MKIRGGTLLAGDCFDLFDSIEDNTIDAIIADLPLGLLWRAYKRILKNNGVILLFAKTPFDKELGASNLAWLKYEWIWAKNKPTGHLNAKKRPMSLHENILVFYQKMPTYLPQKTRGHMPTNYNKKTMEVQNRTEVYGKCLKEITGGGETTRYPTSILYFPKDKDSYHPTQKPVKLLEYLLKTYTNKDDVILDNVAGSGTTGIACQNLHRRFILMEKHPKIFKICRKRLEANPPKLLI